MLDRRGVSPHNFVDRQIEHSGNLLALRRAWRPAPQQNRFDAIRFHAGTFDKLLEADVSRCAEFVEANCHFQPPTIDVRSSGSEFFLQSKSMIPYIPRIPRVAPTDF